MALFVATPRAQQAGSYSVQPKVRGLLWEFKRLRAFALYVDQLQRIAGTLPGQQGDVLESIRKQLQGEPCMKEFPRLPPGI